MKVSNQSIKITRLYFFDFITNIFSILFHTYNLIQSPISTKHKKHNRSDIIVISLTLQAIELTKKIGFLKTVDAAQHFGLYLLSTCNFLISQALSGQHLHFRKQNFIQLSYCLNTSNNFFTK